MNNQTNQTNQGKLRGAIVGAYVLLILLLMLSNCHGCDRERDSEEPALPAEEAIDDRSAEERAEEIGNDGEIKVTALWDFHGDVDLHVTEPDGTELWFRNMKHRSTGGELDVDDINGGLGSAENIYWSNPAHGEYKVELVMYNIKPDAPHGGRVTVVIKNHGQQQTIPVNLTRQSQRVVVKRFTY